jgi:hypothetical protein
MTHASASPARCWSASVQLGPKIRQRKLVTRRKAAFNR